MSGPLDCSNTVSDAGRVPFSAPLTVGNGVGGVGDSSNSNSGAIYSNSSTSSAINSNSSNRGYYKKRRKKSLAGIKSSLYRSFSEKKRPWVVPVGRKEGGEGGVVSEEGIKRQSEIDGSNVNVQWALGKAGEDRVHVVVSEEHGWLFIGIYDGFNGPDAPEFLMGHLYRNVFHEVKGLFWDNEDDSGGVKDECNVVEREREQERSVGSEGVEIVKAVEGEGEGEGNCGVGGGKKVTFLQEDEKRDARRKLWEFLAEDDAEDGLDLSGSDRFAFSVDDAIRVSNVGSRASKRSLMLSKLKQGWSRSKDGHSKGGLFHWRFGVGEKDKVDVGNRVEEEEEKEKRCRNGRRKTGPVDHELVLRALGHALEKTENAYLELTERVIDQYPELALMGSCLLAVLMRDEDVYVMNLGDSRAIVAQYEPEDSCSSAESKEKMVSGSSTEGIVEECTARCEKGSSLSHDCSLQAVKLSALQLSTDHSTSIEEVRP